MKKYYINFKKIFKNLSIAFTKIFIYGIVVGVISGLIVTFLFYTPKISLIGSNVKIEDDKYYFEFIYENKGQSPAIDIESISKYVILHKNKIIGSDASQLNKEKLEAGDILGYAFSIDTIKEEKDIFKNSELIILCKIRYKDSHKLRNFINTRLLNNQYSSYRLSFYDVSKNEKILKLLTLEERNKFKEIIDELFKE